MELMRWAPSSILRAESKPGRQSPRGRVLTVGKRRPGDTQVLGTSGLRTLRRQTRWACLGAGGGGRAGCPAHSSHLSLRPHCAPPREARVSCENTAFLLCLRMVCPDRWTKLGVLTALMSEHAKGSGSSEQDWAGF